MSDLVTTLINSGDNEMDFSLNWVYTHIYTWRGELTPIKTSHFCWLWFQSHLRNFFLETGIFMSWIGLVNAANDNEVYCEYFESLMVRISKVKFKKNWYCLNELIAENKQ